ncbi:(4Fe-4S)-binding protein [Ekhidna sp. To15]|uniref:(4Fe-4S)-binding protein n=1 Tax=Ekhidna sp. To15 TaxID=3395267 RepID=UPI003F527021
MAEKVKEYKSDDLTVIWKPEKCIHSEICYKGLSDVFDPKERPWVNVNGAADATIKDQIDKCPSGALSYTLNDDTDKQDQIEDEQIVEVTKGGPLMVYGNIKVKNHDGSETAKHRVTAFCRCGASSNKPYCDGSHKSIDFEG